DPRRVACGCSEYTAILKALWICLAVLMALSHLDVISFQGVHVFAAGGLIGTALPLSALPLLLSGTALVRAGFSGLAMFRPTRFGRGGRQFTMHKMRCDLRVTPVGRVLRRFSVDDLPQ